MMNASRYADYVTACYACSSACDACAVSCLGETDVQPLAECIRRNLDCADVCRAAAVAMARAGMMTEALCAVCADACDACAAECRRHVHMDHCRICANACEQCAAMCREMLDGMDQRVTLVEA